MISLTDCPHHLLRFYFIFVGRTICCHHWVKYIIVGLLSLATTRFKPSTSRSVECPEGYQTVLAYLCGLTSYLVLILEMMLCVLSTSPGTTFMLVGYVSDDAGGSHRSGGSGTGGTGGTSGERIRAITARRGSTRVTILG